MSGGEAPVVLSPGERLVQAALALATLAFAWLGFQALHELGHAELVFFDRAV